MDFDHFKEIFNTAYNGTYSVIREKAGGEKGGKMQLTSAEGKVIRDIVVRAKDNNIGREQIVRIFFNLNENDQKTFPHGLRGSLPLSIVEAIEWVKATPANVIDSKDSDEKTTTQLFAKAGAKASEFELAENSYTDVDNIEEIVAKGMVLGPGESETVSEENLHALVSSLNKLTGGLWGDYGSSTELFSEDSFAVAVNNQAHNLLGEGRLNAKSVYDQLVAMADSEREKKLSVARIDYKESLEGLVSEIFVKTDGDTFKVIKCYNNAGDGPNEIVHFQGARIAIEAIREVGGTGAAHVFKETLFDNKDGRPERAALRQAFEEFDEIKRRGLDEQELREGGV